MGASERLNDGLLPADAAALLDGQRLEFGNADQIAAKRTLELARIIAPLAKPRATRPCPNCLGCGRATKAEDKTSPECFRCKGRGRVRLVPDEMTGGEIDAELRRREIAVPR